MKRWWIYLILVFSFAVVAQQVAEQQDESEPAAEQVATDTTENGDETGTGADTDDPAGEQDDNEAGLAGIEGDIPEPDPDMEATEVADEVDLEFEPDEEISEDYPVPLPSDI